jgi:hypothetical protein
VVASLDLGSDSTGLAYSWQCDSPVEAPKVRAAWYSGFTRSRRGSSQPRPPSKALGLYKGNCKGNKSSRKCIKRVVSSTGMENTDAGTA